MGKLRLALPVMLHREDEIESFKRARDRLEILGESCGVPLEVNAFLLYLPKSSRTAE